MFPCKTPDPPYFAVIFPSIRAGDDEAYQTTARKMEQLAAEQPGFLGLESVRDRTGKGITVSYWESEEAIRAWHQHPEHQKAQAQGKTTWYRDYAIRVARVDRAYNKESK